MATNKEPRCRCYSGDCNGRACSCVKNRVIVCIGSDRVMVPCGDVKILVRDVITMAKRNYQKVHNNAVPVAYLRWEGAILKDNILANVVDNREVLTACAPLVCLPLKGWEAPVGLPTG
ncbi:hypothetical protein DAPPUDRAFT_249729 [Daphnia pulex]|uniref:Par3/HAL N-terminal domain-containing protein n=1 Tax=Daphnia pulex TaxID=6669 RepID=E9GX68_DAPPU|nr:hypothetical protein DAPPUDRAFT_249729 [Daphnia pulex]|eukprot:EFX75916.1 hypothetical protein DAPPUDRAFT_249729 [Daphnia pulex]